MKAQMILLILMLFTVRLVELLLLVRELRRTGGHGDDVEDADILTLISRASLEQIIRLQRYTFDIRNLLILFPLIVVSPL